MKQRILLFAITILLFAGCQDEQKRFCVQASTSLCEKCQECGDYKACGLTRASTKEDCISTLENVCAAYDIMYSSEVANSCLHSIQSLSCETLKRDGKPEVCTRLF